MTPRGDLGARPQQLLGVVLAPLAAGAVVRLFLFMTALTLPLWSLLAYRALRVPAGVQCWALTCLLLLLWLDPRITIYLRWGLVSYVAAAHFSVAVLALLLRFLERPRARSYAALTLAAALLLLLHPLGPLAIVVPAAAYALGARPLSGRWRLALLLMPLAGLALNAFWFVPYLASGRIPWPSSLVYHAPPDAVRHLVYPGVSEVLAQLASPKAAVPLLAALGLAALGLPLLREACGPRTAWSFGLASGFCLFMTYGGSLLPMAGMLQPMRFKLPAVVLLSLPVGAGLASLTRRLRLPVAAAAGLAALALAVLATAAGRPRPLEVDPEPVAAFAARSTAPDARLLVESRDGYNEGGHESRVLPLTTGREVIGSNFPLIEDSAQFLRGRPLGRAAAEWAPEAVREALDRWGIHQVVTVTEESKRLFTEALGEPGHLGEGWTAFAVPSPGDRVLVGSARVNASVNRLELSDLEPEDGWIVLRYRFHPGWVAESGTAVHRWPVPEDSAGFLALRDPPERLVLRFDPWLMLRADWPDHVVAGRPVEEGR